MNFGGYLEKFGGQNPRNLKKEGGHGKPWRLSIQICLDHNSTVVDGFQKKLTQSHVDVPLETFVQVGPIQGRT